MIPKKNNCHITFCAANCHVIWTMKSVYVGLDRFLNNGHMNEMYTGGQH